MKTYEVADCIVASFRDRDPVEADDHLYGAGRAITWVRVAADTLDATRELKAAEYHAYAGISAARTAIDGVASWLRVIFRLPFGPRPARIDLAKREFIEEVRPRVTDSAVLGRLEALGRLASAVDNWRQRAQHREGVQPIRRSDIGWCVAPLGYASPHTDHVNLTQMLRGWADEIEHDLCAVVAGVPTT